jgi:hypothetical protein
MKKANNCIKAIVLVLLAAIACSKTQQPIEEKSTQSPFVGTWKFISLKATSTEGDVFLPYGENFYGRLMYDNRGNMSFLSMRPNRPKFVSGDIYKGTSEEYKTAFVNFDAYCGTYKIDNGKKTVTHYIEGCRFPNWEGTEQVRHYEFTESGLTLSATLTLKNKKWDVKATLIKQ